MPASAIGGSRLRRDSAIQLPTARLQDPLTDALRWPEPSAGFSAQLSGFSVRRLRLRRRCRRSRAPRSNRRRRRSSRRSRARPSSGRSGRGDVGAVAAAPGHGRAALAGAHRVAVAVGVGPASRRRARLPRRRSSGASRPGCRCRCRRCRSGRATSALRPWACWGARSPPRMLLCDMVVAPAAGVERSMRQRTCPRCATGGRGFARLEGSFQPLATLDALEHQRDALADADAHRAQRVAAAAAVQLVHRGRHQPRAARAERMAERDRAAVRVDARVVVGEARGRAAPPGPARRRPR